MIQVTINGQRRELPDASSVCDMLAAMGLATGARVAVEVNRQVVPRGRHAGTKLTGGEQIEVVTLVGGG
jgi:sulfur carrier protein